MNEGSCEKGCSFPITATSADLRLTGLSGLDTDEPSVCHSHGFLPRVPKPFTTRPLPTFPMLPCPCAGTPQSLGWELCSTRHISETASCCSCVREPAALPSYSATPSWPVLEFAITYNYTLFIPFSFNSSLPLTLSP